MKTLVSLGLIALLSACTIAGYKELDGLKAEAKHRVSREVDGEPVLVYRDLKRSVETCAEKSPQRAWSVTSNLDRQSGRGQIDLMLGSQYLGRFETSPVTNGKTSVSAWWGFFAESCQLLR